MTIGKDDIMTIGKDDELALSHANMFNHQIGNFPIKYLGAAVTTS